LLREAIMTKKKEEDIEQQPRGSFGGILKGLTDLVEKLGDLAEKGEHLSRTGEVQWKGRDKTIKGVYGFSIKTGLGGEGIKVEPFGNIRRDKSTGHSVVEEVSEPLVDVFEEEGYTLLVFEIPGIGSVEDVRLEIKDDVLTLHAERGDKKYYKEILLPRSYDRQKMKVSCNNGILEVKCLN